MFIDSYFFIILLTVIIEVVVAWLLGYRDKLSILSVIIVNLITNPILNYILWLNQSYGFMYITSVKLILLETVVIIVETLLLVFSLRKSWKRLSLLSLIMNAVSLTVGEFILRNL